MVRIAGSHPADPGSSPGLGTSFSFPILSTLPTLFAATVYQQPYTTRARHCAHTKRTNLRTRHAVGPTRNAAPNQARPRPNEPAPPWLTRDTLVLFPLLPRCGYDRLPAQRRAGTGQDITFCLGGTLGANKNTEKEWRKNEEKLTETNHTKTSSAQTYTHHTFDTNSGLHDRSGL